MNKPLLAVASMAEALTGVGLLVAPSLLTRMLFGAEVADVGAVISRIAGISLVSLGVACWPDDAPNRAGYGMLTYSLLAMLFLVYLGIGGKWTGMLLWPGAIVHAGLIAFLIRAWGSENRARSRRLS
jgi:hypothetical protein